MRNKQVNDAVKRYSISNRLKSEGKIDKKFEFYLSNMTLEEIIGLKLELSSRMISHKLYGLHLFSNMTRICKDALLRYALSASRTKSDAALFLGMTKTEFRKYLKRYQIDL